MRRYAVVGLTVLTGLLAAGAVLAQPVGNQFQVSEADGLDARFDQADPDTAYNAQTGQTLVVYDGPPNDAGSDPNDSEVAFVRLVDAAGNPVGAERAISDPVTGGGFVREPRIAYNADANQFLAVWSGGTGNDEDVYGQLLDASGNEIGPDDFQISQIGGVGPGSDGDNQDPDVAYGAGSDEYLVIWDDNKNGGTGSIRAQRVSPAGAEVGADDFEITDVSGDADSPQLAYNPDANEYLVAWEGFEEGDGDEEVFGQRLSGSGADVGADDFRVSLQGGSPDDGLDAENVAVVHNAPSNEYLVVWEGERFDDDEGNEEVEIFGQRLSAAGADIGGDFRLTSQGADGDVDIDAEEPGLAHDAAGNQYLLAWDAEVVEDENEVFAQCLDSTAAAAAAPFRVSTHGPDGDADFDGEDPDVAFNAASTEYLTAWQGSASVDPEDDSKDEVFGRRARCRAAATQQQPPPGDEIDEDDDDTRRPRIAVQGLRGRRACTTRSSRVRLRIRDASRVRTRVRLDGRQIRSTRRKRFTVRIRTGRLSPGRHRLTVISRDAAGNRRRVTLRFSRCAPPPPRVAPVLTG